VTAHIAPHEIEAAADPARYIGLSGREVDRVLAAVQGDAIDAE
jgi:3-carboxy-cis,cis-muconate cycloisomerase